MKHDPIILEVLEIQDQKMKWHENLKRGKGRVILPARRVRALVAHYRPRGWNLHQIGVVPYYDGASYYPQRLIVIPLLICNFSMFTFFHEVGHVQRGHFANFDCNLPGRTLPGHVEEYEAENYAYHLMLAEAVPLPSVLVAGMRWNLNNYIRQDKKLDIQIMPYVLKGMQRWRAST